MSTSEQSTAIMPDFQSAEGGSLSSGVPTTAFSPTSKSKTSQGSPASGPPSSSGSSPTRSLRGSLQPQSASSAISTSNPLPHSRYSKSLANVSRWEGEVTNLKQFSEFLQPQSELGGGVRKRFRKDYAAERDAGCKEFSLQYDCGSSITRFCHVTRQTEGGSKVLVQERDTAWDPSGEKFWTGTVTIKDDEDDGMLRELWKKVSHRPKSSDASHH